MEYICLDLETTGLSPVSDEILEIGAWKVKDGVCVDKFCRLVRPSRFIPMEIQSLTGITNDMTAVEEPIEVILPEFFEWCGDTPFVGHNLSFDYGFLLDKGIRLGLDFSNNGNRLGYDTLKLARKCLNFDNNKLGSLVERFGITLAGSLHRAETDAYAVKLLFDRFLYLYPAYVRPELLPKYKGECSCNETLSFT